MKSKDARRKRKLCKTSQPKIKRIYSPIQNLENFPDDQETYPDNLFTLNSLAAKKNISYYAQQLSIKFGD